MKTVIREASEQDAPAISRIYAASWKAAYRGMVPQQFLDELSDDFWTNKFSTWLGSSTLRAGILQVDEVPAGCVAFGESRDEKLPEWGEIVSIYLHPDFFRKGLGTKLLGYAANELKAAGYPACFLWVLRENRNAQNFYEKNGFVGNGDICHSEIMGTLMTDIRYCAIF